MFVGLAIISVGYDKKKTARDTSRQQIVQLYLEVKLKVSALVLVLISVFLAMSLCSWITCAYSVIITNRNEAKTMKSRPELWWTGTIFEHRSNLITTTAPKVNHT